ncbi:MAG TPA: hypothetical protein VKA01_05100 [Vicinamibacteria bacterium]|nr:hypothetical protein [Vicinamibacteria bacterium]
MACVRGRDLLDAIDFVHESYGASALEHVVARLAEPALSCFRGSIREVAWYPLDALVAFLRTAQATLAPGDSGFCRRQGRYAAQRQREAFLGVMVATAESRAMTAPTIWRMFYDTGHLVVAGGDPARARGQIHAFPTTPELCERFRGIWEGMVSTLDQPASATETRCVLRGDAFCEFEVSFAPETANPAQDSSGG